MELPAPAAGDPARRVAARAARRGRPVQRGVPRGAADPALHPVRRPAAAGAADRRDRPGRRRVRGAAARVPRRGVGDRARARHVHGRRGRRSWCSPPTGAASCTTRCAAAASTTGSSSRSRPGSSRSCGAARRRPTLALIESATQFVGHVRSLDLDKPPGVAEAINWVSALSALGATELVRELVGRRRSARSPRPPTTATWCSRRSRPTRSAEPHGDRAGRRPGARRRRPRGAGRRARPPAARRRRAGDACASMSAFTEALAAAPPAQVPALYWLARLTLVNRQHDLAVVRRGLRGGLRRRGAPRRPARPPARARSARAAPTTCSPRWRRPRRAATGAGDCPGTPCRGPRPRRRGRRRERRCPSCCRARWRGSPTPRSTSSTRRELAVLGRWLEEAAPRWPTRRSRRQRVRPAGHRVALRETIAASRRTGWEPMELQRYRPGAPPPDGHAALRRQPVDAGLRHGVPAPDARVRAHPPGGDVRVLDLADPAHPGARAPLGRGGGRAWRGSR